MAPLPQIRSGKGVYVEKVRKKTTIGKGKEKNKKEKESKRKQSLPQYVIGIDASGVSTSL